MLRSLFLIGITLAFLGLGVATPFVLTLGYVWVDTFQPQQVALFVLNQLPMAMIMGVAALGSYVLMDRRSPPHITVATTITVAMGLWLTATMFWAEVPAAGWPKWDWAFKTVMFSAFMPFVIRSRVQIESFAQIYVFALAANFIPFGMKTLISGGGYGHNLGLEGGNSALSEGGLLSTVCLMAVPLALYLSRHTQLLPRTRMVALGYAGMCVLAVATALGTFERSALVGLVVMGAYMFTRSRHKMLFGLVATVVVAALIYRMSGAWDERIGTIQDPTQDSSALVRLLVWKWTLGYVATHVFGGGFNCFVINRIELPDGTVEFARAFHSIYFEMLGEQGWPGLAMYFTLIISTFIGLHRLARRTRNVPHLAWCADMSDALQASLAVFLSAGAFVGIAFQAPFWYFIAMSVSLREYVRRVEQGQAEPVGWRARRLPATVGRPGQGGIAAGAPVVSRWRHGPDGHAAHARAVPLNRS